jgi:hypothetical protein
MGLNLAGADLKGFDPIPADTYECAVQEVTDIAIKGETGNLPKGTPGINVQFRVTGGEFDNRRVFNNYWIAPAKIAGKAYDKKKMMDGMLAKFFIAIGFDEAEVTGGDFDPDYDDLVGRECLVVVGQKEYPKDSGEMQNVVKNVKPVGSGVTTSSLI